MKLQLRDTQDDHRRVLAVITFLEAATEPTARPSPPRSSSPDTARADNSDFATNPTAGLAVIRSANSPSEYAEINTTGAWSSAISRCARSKPLSSPRSMSTRMTSGRSSAASWSASDARAGGADDRAAFPFEEVARRRKEVPVVVDEEIAQLHGHWFDASIPRIAGRCGRRMAGSRKIGTPAGRGSEMVAGAKDSDSRECDRAD